jgi:hypothetical protein
MKALKLIFIGFAALILSSCTAAGAQIQDLIAAPANTIPPIEGKWEIISSIYTIGNSASKNNSDYVGVVGLFHKDGVVIGQDYTTNPSYNIKKVNTSDYMIYKYKISPNSLGLQSKTLQVITVLNENKYFCELLKIDDDTMIIIRDDIFYEFVRTVPKVSIEEVKRYIDVEQSVQNSFGGIAAEDLNSGILLGIKTQSFDEENELPMWNYKTYWIQMDDRVLTDIYQLDDLLVPRKNGFWMIKQIRSKTVVTVTDEVTATPLFKFKDLDEFIQDRSFNPDEKISSFNLAIERAVPSILKNIIFVGNDYISIENIDMDRGERRTLQVYALDNLSEKKPIKLSDLVGEAGVGLFLEGAKNVISVVGEVIPNEENVGLARRNGYWTLKGRVNYRDKESELFREFNIKAIPPKEMVSYDELSIPFDAVRLAVPDVIDVFSSPNNDFIVVITTSSIVIYSIEGYDLNLAPLARIEFPNDSSVVMSEWSTDRYPDIWGAEMLKQGAIEVEKD